MIIGLLMLEHCHTGDVLLGNYHTPDYETLNSAPLWLKVELMSLKKPYASLSSLLFTNPTTVKSLSHSQKLVEDSYSD